MLKPRWPVALISVVIVALTLKTALLATHSVAFTSDEAVMALMGKHITQGHIPIFYYGEAYVGSLDAILIALTFKLIGQSIVAVRLVQIILYTGTMLITFFLTRRIYQDESAARIAVLLMAVPPVLLSLHTTAGLGSYGETLLIGGILMLIGHRLLTDDRPSRLLWGLFGLLSGVGFWSFGLILVYLAPIGILMLSRFKLRPWKQYLLCGAAFLVGSMPWWWYNFVHDWAALKVFYDAQAGTAIVESPLWERALGTWGLGIPALIGLRPSWSIEWTSVALSPFIVVFYLSVMIYAVQQWRQKRNVGQTMLLLYMLLFVTMLVGTRFGADSSGRYMLPLYSALWPLCGAFLSRAKTYNWFAGILIVALITSFNLLGNAQAIFSERGLTTEFWSEVRFDRESDDTLIAFLLDHDLHYGYSNRHTHFRTDFISDERILLLPRLSSRSGLCINLDGHGDRYPAYTESVENSPIVFYITTEQPYLDELLRNGFAQLGVTYAEKVIGPYRVFYDLSQTVRPRDLCEYEDGV
ncbi:MAG: glycosyltransferase family 39 protein [Anaerolineae bacterium]|nr:glycosyltransferase family 39 protein [Anaerolineae bacterium]